MSQVPVSDLPGSTVYARTMSAALTERTVNTAALRPVLMNVRVTVPAEAFTSAVTSRSYGSARAGRTPCSCFGMPKVICEVEDGVRLEPLAECSSSGRNADVFGSDGLLSLGLAKLKKEVKSLLTARRQGVMFGLCTPKRFSMNLMTEV